MKQLICQGNLENDDDDDDDDDDYHHQLNESMPRIIKASILSYDLKVDQWLCFGSP